VGPLSEKSIAAPLLASAQVGVVPKKLFVCMELPPTPTWSPHNQLEVLLKMESQCTVLAGTISGVTSTV
jgi:hypothetical protein